ncbi:MAG: PorT family protein [Muribaculaceae bacterium]|nr:PorT family protein [Muribaculaceae bacterium]MDE6631421.1 PorT family protein [Muribaculaceae bacterium]
MKRFAIFLLVMFSALASLRAQTHFDSRVDIGAHGGVTFSTVTFKPTITSKFGMGYTGGVTFRYSEENHFGLIAEVNLVQRGWAEKFEDLPYNYQRTLNYVEVPIMSHIYFGSRGKFFINAGPEVAYYLGDHINSNFDYHNTQDLPGFHDKNRRDEQLTMKVSQKLDFGIVAGLGGEFNINRKNSVALEARLYYGIGNVMPSGRQDTFSLSNQLSVAVTAGYWFRIK